MRKRLASAVLVLSVVGCAVAPSPSTAPPPAPPPAAAAAPNVQMYSLVRNHAAIPFVPSAAPLHSAQIYKPGNIRKGCPPEGDAKPDAVKAVNILKNRITPPSAADFDRGVTLAAMAKPGDDDDRWDDNRAATVVGYVRNVKPGGTETCNCKATAIDDRDTHIELVLDPAHAKDTDVIVVEVTPRWRDAMAADGVDWSTPTLQSSLKGQWVKVSGWLMYDYEHENQSENTSPGNASNWRRTAWEIHPITQIDVVSGPGQ